MDKNPPKTEKAKIDLTDQDKAKPRAEVVRYVVQHTHKPAEPETKPKPKLKKQDPRIGRAKRLLDEVELWESKAKAAEVEVETHYLVDKVEEAKLACEWLDRESTQREAVALTKRESAMRAGDQADRNQEEAERLQGEARRLREHARLLRVDAAALDKENKRVLQRSLNDGPHRKLKELEKQFNTDTHRIARKGREAKKRAAKLRDKLKALLTEIAPLLEEENGNGKGKESSTPKGTNQEPERENKEESTQATPQVVGSESPEPETNQKSDPQVQES